MLYLARLLVLTLTSLLLVDLVAGLPELAAQSTRANRQRERRTTRPAVVDAKNRSTGKADPAEDPALIRYGIYEQSAPRALLTAPVSTDLPLQLDAGDRIAYIGNTLLERSQHFGHLESLIHQRFPQHQLVIRNLAWPTDTPALQPRPANFADLDQHLTFERSDVILAAFGFNESFAGLAGLSNFKRELTDFVAGLRSKAFNGNSGPRIVLLSPIANENVPNVPAADMNNARIRQYVEAMREVARAEQVAFVDLFAGTAAAMQSSESQLTINGCHLNAAGYRQFAAIAYRQLFGADAPQVSEPLRKAVLDKNAQYFRRYRPLNTFYYTGDRNKSYGYLDFLPAMRSFDLMVQNRDRRIWKLAQGQRVAVAVDDSNVPPLPKTKESRGANRWITADAELKEFKIDPRFEVNLFAGEEQFPDIAAPIQMRWDARGRLWVSCSTTYPHVYPGNEPNDKLVILEDTNGDGRADKSTVFADDLHIPLSFEFGNGGVYVSEMPHLTFIKDTNGDGKADFRQRLLTGFGTEDSHHSLHDFTWTPDGDLLFRESIFHHSQVETPYGPIRQANSGWFRFQPRDHRLTSFGTYHSTNPWGVTFDDWGQHVASHPIYAAAFHSLDPPYPQQHAKPTGLRAYSGTCGQEFVDFSSFPREMQGSFIKVRYKPTNRVEIHRWKEYEFGFDEEYVGDLIFSSNLSFIPVDLRYGPRGAMYVCDWYNPIKGHAQYSLRDERRDRHSGRIWRITAKEHALVEPPPIAGAATESLVRVLERPEYRYRYWAKRELRERPRAEVIRALDRWVSRLSADDPRLGHHQLEAVWTYRSIGAVRVDLLRELLQSDHHLARAAAVEQLRFWHPFVENAPELLRRAANDPSSIVRMQAAIAASYIGSAQAFEAALDVLHHPRGGHLAYAINSAFNSHTLRRHWEGGRNPEVARFLRNSVREQVLREPPPSAGEAEFDSQPGLKVVRISCVPERMLFTVKQFSATTGQPIKVVFTNPDATDHNLVFVKPGALEEVGMAANAMARDPKNANSDFIPRDKRPLILQATRMIGPTRRSSVHVLRFTAPTEPGIYPYVCTFPGHWVVMKGEMAVAETVEQAEKLLAASQPSVVQEWSLGDFAGLKTRSDERSVMRGMQAFMKARCDQCHAVAGHGVNLGPELKDVHKRLKGIKLLEQILDPSTEINDKYRIQQFVLTKGNVVAGVVVKEDAQTFHVVSNLLNPTAVTKIAKRQVDERIPGRVSPMPVGLLNVLTKEEIIDLVSFIEVGGYHAPGHLKHQHPK